MWPRLPVPSALLAVLQAAGHSAWRLQLEMPAATGRQRLLLPAAVPAPAATALRSHPVVKRPPRPLLPLRPAARTRSLLCGFTSTRRA